MGFNVPFKPFCTSVVQWCIFKWPENSDILPWIWSYSVLAESVPDWTEWAHPAHLMHPLTSPVSWSSVLSGLSPCMCRSQFSFNLPFQPSFPSLWIWSKRSTSFLCKTKVWLPALKHNEVLLPCDINKTRHFILCLLPSPFVDLFPPFSQCQSLCTCPFDLCFLYHPTIL